MSTPKQKRSMYPSWLSKADYRRVMRILVNVEWRCSYPGTNKYEYYGGKGIKCLLSFYDLQYLWERDRAADMVQPSIDRLNSNDNYSFVNCRFIELKENRTHRDYSKMRPYRKRHKFHDL